MAANISIIDMLQNAYFKCEFYLITRFGKLSIDRMVYYVCVCVYVIDTLFRINIYKDLNILWNGYDLNEVMR